MTTFALYLLLLFMVSVSVLAVDLKDDIYSLKPLITEAQEEIVALDYVASHNGKGTRLGRPTFAARHLGYHIDMSYHNFHLHIYTPMPQCPSSQRYVLDTGSASFLLDDLRRLRP